MALDHKRARNILKAALKAMAKNTGRSGPIPHDPKIRDLHHRYGGAIKSGKKADEVLKGEPIDQPMHAFYVLAMDNEETIFFLDKKAGKSPGRFSSKARVNKHLRTLCSGDLGKAELKAARSCAGTAMVKDGTMYLRVTHRGGGISPANLGKLLKREPTFKALLKLNRLRFSVKDPPEDQKADISRLPEIQRTKRQYIEGHRQVWSGRMTEITDAAVKLLEECRSVRGSTASLKDLLALEKRITQVCEDWTVLSDETTEILSTMRAERMGGDELLKQASDFATLAGLGTPKLLEDADWEALTRGRKVILADASGVLPDALYLMQLWARVTAERLRNPTGPDPLQGLIDAPEDFVDEELPDNELELLVEDESDGTSLVEDLNRGIADLDQQIATSEQSIQASLDDLLGELDTHNLLARVDFNTLYDADGKPIRHLKDVPLGTLHELGIDSDIASLSEVLGTILRDGQAEIRDKGLDESRLESIDRALTSAIERVCVVRDTSGARKPQDPSRDAVLSTELRDIKEEAFALKNQLLDRLVVWAQLRADRAEEEALRKDLQQLDGIGSLLDRMALMEDAA